MVYGKGDKDMLNQEFLLELGIDGEVSEKILARYNTEKIEAAVERELLGQGVCDRSAAEALLERDGLSEENIAERVGNLKKEHPNLFKSDVPKIVSTAQPSEAVEKGEFEKMSYRERLELFKKSPDVYKKLVK